MKTPAKQQKSQKSQKRQKSHKAQKNQKSIVNRRAKFDYHLGDEISAGLELTGAEVRAARNMHVSLQGAFVNISKDGEVFLTNATFTLKTNQKAAPTVNSTRDIKLLIKKSEIKALRQAKQTGLTIIPLRLKTSGRYIKLIIATAKGKKSYDKRETIKKRDQDRETKRMMK